MLNLRRKSLLIKSVVAILIALLLWIIIAVTFGVVYVNSYKQSYFDLQTQTIETVQENFYSRLGSIHTDIKGMKWDPETAPDASLYADYSVITYVHENGSAVQYNLDSTAPERMENHEVNAVVLRNIKRTLENNSYYIVISTVDYWYENINHGDKVLYSVVKKVGSDYIILCKDMRKIVGEFERYTFDSIFLIVNRGEILYDVFTGDLRRNEFSTKLTDESELGIQHKLREEGEYSSLTDYDGSRYVISLSSAYCPETEGYNVIDGLRIVGFRNPEEIDVLTDGVVTRHIIESVAIFLIFIFAFGYVAISFMKNNDTIMFSKALGNFVFNVNGRGKVLWSNVAFAKQFGLKDISPCVDTTVVPLHNQLLSGKVIILHIIDSDNVEHYVAATALRQFGRFRVVGSEMTTVLTEYYALKHSDTCDAVTDLPIQKMFSDKIDAIKEKGKGIVGSLAIIGVANLDALKMMLGEHSFKKVIATYANTLKREWNKYGELFYLNNGNFLFFTESVTKTNTLVSRLPELMETLHLPIRYNDNSIILETRVGVVVLNTRDAIVTVDNLLSNGQLSLENAMNSIRQNFYVLHPTNFTSTRTNFTAPGVVKSMVENGEIAAYFQPQYSLTTNKIVGFEALCRIVGNKSKEIPIFELITIAEKYGGMVDLGNFICERSMDFAKQLEDKNIEVSVNVSPIQLMQVGFTDGFIKMYEKKKLRAGCFNIEITEGAALYSFDEAVAKLNLIRNTGVGIHIDDFGVAYSSMLHLKLLPATTLKIDKSLVDDICDSEDASNMVKNIINLAKDLGLQSIAEGVEAPEQLEHLRNLGCDVIQGFIIGRALPKANALELIKEVNGDE